MADALLRACPARSSRLIRFAMICAAFAPLCWPLNGSTPWYILEPLETGGEIVARVEHGSEFLPFNVHLSISEAAIEAVAQSTSQILNGFGFVLALLSLLVGYHLGRYRPDEGERILDALDNGEFVPFLQPIVDLSSGSIIGCEVLARWHRPDGTLVPPQDFIPMAQTYHLTEEVTCYIMEEP